MKPLEIARDTEAHVLLSNMANRHGIIAGATGTGKTITLKVLAEQFSSIGVPVFLADIKGDLSGFCEAGTDSPKLQERMQKLGMKTPDFTDFPVQFWDLQGEKGALIRATVTDLGPMLLSRILDLNENQAGLLEVIFRIADDHGLLLLDLKDMKKMLNYTADHVKDFERDYGTYTKQSVGVILRKLLALEERGANSFFGEPALDIRDFMTCDNEGRGIIHILNAASLLQTPALYSTFLLWLLAELFEILPEAGDLDQPKLVFFFDEAHLLFTNASKPLLEKIEQVVRLIRSKGVGIYFVTQNPLDIPESVLAQLGNRVQHALRAFTPKDQKAVRVAAETFRQDKSFSVEEAIMQLAVGEALVSFLDETGTPTFVRRAFVVPPRSKFGPADPEVISAVRRRSKLDTKYNEIADRESAYEVLNRRVQEAEAAVKQEAKTIKKLPDEYEEAPSRRPVPAKKRTTRGDDVFTSATKSFARSAMSSVGREVGGKLGKSILRGLLGSFLK